MIATDLIRQQALMPIQKQCNKFYWKSRNYHYGAIFFIIEEAKETVLDISQGTVKVL